MTKITKLIIGLLLVVVIALAFGGGFFFGHSSNSNINRNLDVIGEVWDIIFTDYVDRSRLDSDNMTRTAIEGMIETLNDPYTSYLEPEYYEMGISSLEGEFDGIGAYVSVQDGNLIIIAPIADSPADKAGIKASDIIMEINGEPVTDMSLAEAIIKIRGPKGTTVTLLILHEGETEPVEIEIIRATIEVSSVNFEMRGDIAYIIITQFSQRTGDELMPVIQDLKEENARGIVLDLRGNSGGLLDIVVEVASIFINKGTLVEVMSNRGKVASMEVIDSPVTTDLPMVVLVDAASASGSEVLSGALQDHDRALVAGNTTFGKGSVNILHNLSDGSGLYITTARWLTPNGHVIEGHGIEPDIILELTGEDAVDWAIDYLTGSE